MAHSRRWSGGLARGVARWARWAGVAAVAGAVCVGAGSRAEAAPLIRGLGGPAGFGTNFLEYNDDGSSMVIDVSSAFTFGLRFFGMTFRQLYVNNNGNITFGRQLGTFTPAPFPVAEQRMIAPWWGDVDTRGGGRPARNGVWWDVRPGQFTATWHNVGYFNSHDDLQNSFQLILRPSPACGEGDFDVEFRYERCEWTTGDASMGMNGLGGTPAQAGFDAGDRTNHYTLPGSRTMAVLDLCRTSNVGDPGVWRFQIRGGELPCVGSGERCSTGLYGACAQGTVQCRGGRPFCQPDNLPRPERCDGVDNDCDGRTDESDRMPPPSEPPRDPDAGVFSPEGGVPDAAARDAGASDAGASEADGGGVDGGDGGAASVPPLCPRNGDVCFRGVCVPGCVEGACFADQTCTSESVCVETSCLRVDCPPGQLCRGGSCVDPCEGVRCPAPLSCRFGRCLDLCAGVTCDRGQVCREGRCVAGCSCTPCEPGLSCQPDGRCLPALCLDAMCDPGDICDARGRCVNPCDGAVCPAGQRCDRGERRCVDDVVMPPPREPGPEAGPGVPPPDASTPPESDGGIDTPVMDAGPNDGGGGGLLRRPGGCACRTGEGGHDRGGAWSLLGLAAGLAVLARRRSGR